MLGRFKRNDSVGFQEELSRLLSDMFMSTTYSDNFTPQVDVVETIQHIKIMVDIPGVNEEDIELTFEDNVFTLKGKKEREKGLKQENYYTKERYYGSFLRKIHIPKKINKDTINAKFKSGVLEITADKIEQEKTKKISVEVEK